MIFQALVRVVITALCLIRSLNYLSKEEAKHLTTVESILLIRGEALAGLPRAEQEPGHVGPWGQLPEHKVLRRISPSSERSRQHPSVASWLKELFQSSLSPSDSVVNGIWRKQEKWILMPAELRREIHVVCLILSPCICTEFIGLMGSMRGE